MVRDPGIVSGGETKSKPLWATIGEEKKDRKRGVPGTGNNRASSKECSKCCLFELKNRKSVTWSKVA